MFEIRWQKNTRVIDVRMKNGGADDGQTNKQS